MKLLTTINSSRVLFLDIETAPQTPFYSELKEPLKSLWDKKAKYLKAEPETTQNELYQRAGIYAEFGKIICISVGIMIESEDGVSQIRIKSFYGDNEQQILQGFCELLNTSYNSPQYFLCAHNGKEFDFPFLARRMLINDVKIPFLLDNAGKKPWETSFLDTMELWKFGDYKNYTSIALLAAVFGIETPKDDIDGSDIYRVYWQDKDLERIKIYCQKDVVTVAQVYLKYQLKHLILPENIFLI